MFNIIVLFLCVFYLWSSAVAAPYHEADYKLGNGNNNNNNNDGEFHNRKTVIRKSESVLISTSTEAENNPSDVNQFKDYYDNVLKPSFNMTSDPFAYEDTTDNDMTNSRTPKSWNSIEVYAVALIYLIIFILLLSLVKFYLVNSMRKCSFLS